MADTFEGEDLLYNMAYECETLFDHLQDTLRKTKSPDAIVRLCDEFQQRFAIWAAHLGVFARKSQCLDTRLHNLPDLQDLVARLLDVLRVTIRQSGRGKLDAKAKRFAAGLDLSSFAYLCASAVQALYPGAHQSLKDHLSRSMTDRYARMLFLDSRHQNLQTRRELHAGLPPIPEVSNNELPPNKPSLQPRMALRNMAVQNLLRRTPALPQSDLSSVNLRQISSRLRPPDEASTKFHKTSSVQVNQGNYPHIPTGTDGSSVFTCPWCSELLSKKTLSGSEWRQHIDRDLKPYICLSETCPEAHPAYATFDEWHRHMELHDRRWHQRIYLTSSWMCPVCELDSDAYSSPHALYLHLEETHALQDHDGDGNDGTKSDSVDIDEGNSAFAGTDLGRLSHVASEDDVSMKDGSDEGNVEGDIDLDESLGDDVTADDTPVPDSDIDLQFIPRQYDDLAVEDDEFLNELIESGDFLSWDAIPKEFSIARGVMTAARVALMSVPTIINGVIIDLSNKGDDDDDDDDDGDHDGGDHDSTPLLSPSDNSNRTSSDPKATKQLLDESDKSIRPDPVVPETEHQGAASTTVEDKPNDNEKEDAEGDRIVQGMTIYDHVVGIGRPVRIGDTVRANCVLKYNASDGFDGDWRSTNPSEITVGKSSKQAVYSSYLGIIGMRVGGERRVTIPVQLSFGPLTLPDTPTDSQLVTDIRLIEILDGSMNEDDASALDAEYEPEAEGDEPLNKSVEPESGESRRSLRTESEHLDPNASTETAPGSAGSETLNSEPIYTSKPKPTGPAVTDVSSHSSGVIESSGPYEGLVPAAELPGTPRLGPPRPTRPARPTLRLKVDQLVKQSGSIDSSNVMPEADSERDSDSDSWLPRSKSRGKRAVDSISSLARGGDTHQREASQDANREPESSTRPRHDAGVSLDGLANPGEDSGTRLKRVGHVQFDDFPESRASFPSFSDHVVSKEAEEASHTSIQSPDDATARFEIGMPTRESAETGNPFPNQDIVEGIPPVSETEGSMCTIPRRGKTVQGPKEHMVTHQMDQPHRCPFTGCEYHTKEFAREYDRNRHLFTHHNGAMLCGFCPASGPGLERVFHGLKPLKRHLFDAHGVEETPLDGRRPRGSGPVAPKTLAYDSDATGICSICNALFSNFREFYEHLDDCATRVVQQVNLSNSEEKSNERPQRLDTVYGQQGNLGDVTNGLVNAPALHLRDQRS
ncbi:hypothetical protein MKX07_008518 [Trichoderma sp. CBMAI-0711]|nr:hypothetical protein MKX07_008518 [Trichoderma sp. CBMAI-0711]